MRSCAFRGRILKYPPYANFWTNKIHWFTQFLADCEVDTIEGEPVVSEWKFFPRAQFWSSSVKFNTWWRMNSMFCQKIWATIRSHRNIVTVRARSWGDFNQGFCVRLHQVTWCRYPFFLTVHVSCSFSLLHAGPSQHGVPPKKRVSSEIFQKTFNRGKLATTLDFWKIFLTLSNTSVWQRTTFIWQDKAVRIHVKSIYIFEIITDPNRKEQSEASPKLVRFWRSWSENVLTVNDLEIKIVSHGDVMRINLRIHCDEASSSSSLAWRIKQRRWKDTSSRPRVSVEYCHTISNRDKDLTTQWWSSRSWRTNWWEESRFFLLRRHRIEKVDNASMAESLGARTSTRTCSSIAWFLTDIYCIWRPSQAILEEILGPPSKYDLLCRF